MVLPSSALTPALAEEQSDLAIREENRSSVFDLYLKGHSVHSIALKTGHDDRTVKRWLLEMEAEIQQLPNIQDHKNENRELARRRLNMLKASAWQKIEALFWPTGSEREGQPRARGGVMGAARLMEIVLRAEELQARVEGLVGAEAKTDPTEGGKTVVKTVKWIVTGPKGSDEGNGPRAGLVVETTRVLSDESEALGLGGRDRFGEEPRGSDEGHRLRSSMDQEPRSDPGSDQPQLEGYNDPQVLRALPRGGDQELQQERSAPPVQPPDSDNLDGGHEDSPR